LAAPRALPSSLLAGAASPSSLVGVGGDCSCSMKCLPEELSINVRRSVKYELGDPSVPLRYQAHKRHLEATLSSIP